MGGGHLEYKLTIGPGLSSPSPGPIRALVFIACMQKNFQVVSSDDAGRQTNVGKLLKCKKFPFASMEKKLNISPLPLFQHISKLK